jgi:hypothetical protein
MLTHGTERTSPHLAAHNSQDKGNKEKNKMKKTKKK